ncbi:hypothetical protein FOZ62_031678, partial [Perkinsus olseni]
MNFNPERRVSPRLHPQQQGQPTPTPQAADVASTGLPPHVPLNADGLQPTQGPSSDGDLMPIQGPITADGVPPMLLRAVQTDHAAVADPQQGSLLYVSEHTPEGEFSLLSPVPTETGSPPQLPVSKTSETFVRQGIPAQAAYQVQYNNSGPPVKSPSPTLQLRPRVEHPSVAQHCSPGD